MSSDTIHYFGYGSLVNRDTRPSEEIACDARLLGWRRVWNHRVAAGQWRAGCTSLSIVRADDEGAGAAAGIDGVVVTMPREELAALDQREQGYERLTLTASDLVFSGSVPPGLGTVYVYRSLGPAAADEHHPILQSYVDCVMAGYSRRFGQAGLEHFVSSTDGWEGVLLDDRTAPRYPRAVALTTDTRDDIDRMLTAMRCA